MGRGMAIRLLLATAAVGSALGLGFSGSAAEADDHPSPCGYVEVEKNSTTTTETVVSYCRKWTCSGGLALGPNPGGAAGITWDYFICLEHM